MYTLKDKVAIVTGGSRGIGAAIVRRLAQEGAHVAFTYSKSSTDAEKVKGSIENSDSKVTAYQADARNPIVMKTLAETIKTDFGAIDILINNAGVWHMGPIGSIPSEEFKSVYSVNIESVFALTNAVVPLMRDGGRIVNIGSGLGMRAMYPGVSVYNSTKAAVAMLARSWAQDLAARGILVNAIMPGSINTDMNPDSGEFSEMQKQAVPLKRYGRPEEIAGAVAFLVGPDATYVNGAVLNVDGGLNA